MSKHRKAVEHLKAIAEYCGIDGNVRGCHWCVFQGGHLGCLFGYIPCAYRDLESELKKKVAELEQGE